jgi:hypothetical protein
VQFEPRLPKGPSAKSLKRIPRDFAESARLWAAASAIPLPGQSINTQPIVDRGYAKRLTLQVMRKAKAMGVPLEHLPFNWLCTMKYHKTYWRLLEEEQKGSLRATRQLAAARLIYQRWRTRVSLPKDFQFKTRSDHYTLMLAGLPSPLGEMTHADLTDWFEENCSCGEAHSQDALVKLRARTIHEFRAGYLVVPISKPEQSRQPRQKSKAKENSKI